MFSAMIDPTAGPATRRRATILAARKPTLAGSRVGLLANVKRNAEQFLDEVGALLRQEHGGEVVLRRTKSSITDPVPQDILADLVACCDVVVVGVGDCGSCSASAVADGLALEDAGIPAVVVCTDAFGVTADAMAALAAPRATPTCGSRTQWRHWGRRSCASAPLRRCPRSSRR